MATWRMNRPARPQVTATVGSNSPSQGMDALLDFRMEVTLEGESLTRRVDGCPRIPAGWS
jgi:non-specific serine/threonine protein kinase